MFNTFPFLLHVVKVLGYFGGGGTLAEKLGSAVTHIRIEQSGDFWIPPQRSRPSGFQIQV